MSALRDWRDLRDRMERERVANGVVDQVVLPPKDYATVVSTMPPAMGARPLPGQGLGFRFLGVPVHPSAHADEPVFARHGLPQTVWRRLFEHPVAQGLAQFENLASALRRGGGPKLLAVQCVNCAAPLTSLLCSYCGSNHTTES